MNNSYKKSTLKAINVADQTVATDGLVAFAEADATGCSITATGAGGVKINSAGVYLVIFNADVAESGTAGDVTAQLRKNAIPVAGAEATESSTAETDIVNLSFATVIDVPRSCCCVDNDATLTVANTGVGAIYSNASIVVVKLC